MAALGFAVMKYESTTKTPAPNGPQICDIAGAVQRETLGASVLQGFHHARKSSVVVTASHLVCGGVHIVYLSSLSVPIISTYLSARTMLSDTYTNVLEEKKKTTTLLWLEKASSLRQSAGKSSAQEESKRFFNTLIVLSLLYTHTLN